MQSEDPPLPRPTSFDPHELGFTPQKPVPWLGPVLLAGTGVRVALADQFGAYLDKRELQNAFPTRVYDHSQQDDLWLDFVADLGDGFDATYSVAYLLAQQELGVGPARLPRGDLLVMGGDQVYPTASGQRYEDRCKGPYQAALPTADGDGRPAPTLFALPGNHDWYDGLTAFLRLFARRDGGRIGGWVTCQTRSYFALKLPHRWWLLAMDAQGDAYMDDPQVEYFREVAKELRPGDRVIVCTPQPSWVKTEEHPAEYDTIDYFVRTIIDRTGAQVPLMLTGDLHHYARYSQVDGGERQLITFGGGGAYLYATHHLPNRITVPPKKTIVRKSSPTRDFTLERTYPTKRHSRALGAGVFGRLPMRNPGFVGLLGVLHTLLLLALDNSERRVLTVPVFLMVAATFGLTMFFSAGLTNIRQVKHYALGVGHAIAHIGLAIAGTGIWRELPFDGWQWPLPAVTAAAFYGPVAGLVAAQIVALYLLIAARLGVNVNELFAGQGIQGYKGFLRMRFAPDGTLFIYPIGVDYISKSWRLNPDAPPSAPWFEPERPMKARLVDDVIVLRGAAPDAQPESVQPEYRSS